MRRRAWIEQCAWTLGLGLCALYAAGRIGFELARTEGLNLARQARGVVSESTRDTPAQAGTPVQIDQSLWSKKRIKAFAESLSTPATPEGVLRIPSINLEVPIYSGTDEINLNRGAAHIEGTAALAGSGNIGIAGHRDGFFRKLKDITIEGNVDLEVGGRTRRYRVSEIRIVAPSDVEVLHPTATPSITLVTCYPFYFVGNAPLRYIVRAELTGAEPGLSASDPRRVSLLSVQRDKRGAHP